MIVCCGEALIDMIPSADQSGKQSFTPHAGGAVFNTSIALGRLGISVHLLTGISTDMFGKLLVKELLRSNVGKDLVMRSDRPTTLAFVELTNGHATYVIYDENTAGRMLNPVDLPAIPKAVQAMYFGGISLINEPAADFYLALAVRESRQRLVVADPNIRANFIVDEDRYRARLEQLIACVDILKVSDEDLEWIVPGPLTLIEKANVLREKGPEIVILTRGSAGASALFGMDNRIEIAVPKVKVADTIGAGDTFNAGFLASLSQDGLLDKDSIRAIDTDDLRRALEYGAKVAAVTVSRSGANTPWANEL
jgi:fructokinase